MSSKLNLSDRAKKVSALKTETTFKAIDLPGPTANFTTAFKKGSAPKTGLANEHYVYVLPDFSNILMFIIYHAIQFGPSLEIKNHPKVSIPVFVSYCLTLVYAHFLVSDAYINPGQPHFAMTIKNDSAYSEYLDFLLTLPVPEFLTPLFAKFTSTTTSRRTNTWFLASAEGFMHFTHFGRFFPINLFLNMHDLAARTESRANPAEVFYDLNMTEIFHITKYRDPSVTTDTAVTYRYHNFFASLYPTTATTKTRRSMNFFYESRINQVLEGLFNPVLLRAQQQRQAFSRISIEAPTFETANYNPYFALLAITKENIPELMTVMQSVADTINGSIPIKSQLNKMYDNYSGVSILDHGYAGFPTPTWDADSNLPDNDTTLDKFVYNNAVLKFEGIPLSNYAAAIKFKGAISSQSWTLSNNIIARIDRSEAVPNVTDPAPDTVIVTTTITPGSAYLSLLALATVTDRHDVASSSTFYLPNTASGPTDENDHQHMTTGNHVLRSYSAELDNYPTVKVLQFAETDDETAYQATLFGTVIYSDELVGSIVNHPHPTSRVEEDNSLFLTSCIQFRTTHLATNFKTNNPIASIIMKTPAPTNDAQFALSLYRSPNVTIPRITTHTAHSGYHRDTYGLHRMTTNISVPEFSQSILSYTVRDRPSRRHQAPIHEPPSTPYYRLLLWSPYVFVTPNYNRDWEQDEFGQALLDHHYVTNLRTIFGLDATMIEVRSGSAAMPVA
ncbi:capsid protein [Rosellinia necatrix partitivirus 6]|uniref:capsid protein n=1 Tax=Rosellinia necatrix partitivirus 6 TaxID=1573459 RepID=UPI0006F7AD94|nr:capsid protein [Rosellinia necatrix partitivirus 6]BAT24480.1 capsid protein [Rosellinia necatrix partitivirus 6]